MIPTWKERGRQAARCVTALALWLGLGPSDAHAATRLSAGGSQSCVLRADGTGFHSCAVRSSGSLACWGYDAFGLSLPPAGEFSQVSSGYYHSCAVRSDATTKCWGFSTFNQTLPPPGSFRDIESGPFHTCALDFLGGETCWGEYARQAFASATTAAVPLPSWAGVCGAVAVLGIALAAGRKKCRAFAG